jgi:hypothetical protein
LNHQDEEWSTLPARKKAKTKTYVDANPASPGLICVSFLCSGVQVLPGMKNGSKFKLPQALLAGT